MCFHAIGYFPPGGSEDFGLLCCCRRCRNNNIVVAVVDDDVAVLAIGCLTPLVKKALRVITSLAVITPAICAALRPNGEFLVHSQRFWNLE